MATNEWLRRGWARADKALRRVYNELGPKHISRGKIRPYPSRKFAALTKKQLETQWDFDRRHLMHEVAKVLEAD